MSLPDPTRHLFPLRVVRGALYMLGGLARLLTDRSMRRLAVAPILISAFVLAAFVWATFSYYDELAGWLFDTSGVTGWLAQAATFLVMLVLGFVLVMVLLPVVTGPFTDVISERTEALELGKDPDISFSLKGFAKEVGVAIGHALKNLFLFVVLSGVALILGLIPIVGPIAVIVVQLLIMAFFASLEFLDAVANRRQYTFAQKVHVISENRALYAGFGLAAGGLLLVPLLNVVVIPAAVLAGTRLFLHLEAHNVI